MAPAHFKGLSLQVVFMLVPMPHDHQRAAHGEILTKPAERADASVLKPVLDEQRVTLGEVGKACDRLTGSQAVGKVVVEI